MQLVAGALEEDGAVGERDGQAADRRVREGLRAVALLPVDRVVGVGRLLLGRLEVLPDRRRLRLLGREEGV